MKLFAQKEKIKSSPESTESFLQTVLWAKEGAKAAPHRIISVLPAGQALSHMTFFVIYTVSS